MSLGRQAVALAAFAAVLLPAGAEAAPTTGRLLVTLDQRPGTVTRAAAVPAQAGAEVAGPVVDVLRLVTVRPPDGVPLTVTARLLRALPGVRSVEVEHRFTPRYAPNDPALTTPDPSNAGIPIEWWALKQNLPAAWDINRGSGAKVAIIDTGADASHPEFDGRIAKSFDRDGNPGAGGATVDEIGHGSHVASIACGRGNNGIGLVGAGLNCDLLIFKSDFSDASVAESIVQAVDEGADAINMSFGTDGSAPAAEVVTRAIDYAFDRGVIMTAAAADEPVQEQGDPPNVLQPSGTGGDITKGKGLSVTAANFDDGRASFAGFGSQISIAAYGTYGRGGPPGIFGAFPGNQTTLESSRLGSPPCNCRTSFAGDNRYAYLQGTSMAAPMVAAVAALIRDLNPDLAASDTLQILKRTARRTAPGWTPDLGWGILDGGAALAAARDTDRRAPKSRISKARTLADGRVKLTITSSDKGPSGVRSSKVSRVRVWRAYNGRKAKLLKTTTSASVTVKATRGVKYTFFTVATDKAGNREKRPAKPDVTVRRPKKR